MASPRALFKLTLGKRRSSGTAIPEPTKYRYRSSFQENLRALASLLLEKIQDDPQVKPLFCEEGYVPLEANNRHLLLSKRIIATRYNRVAGDGVAPTAIEKIAEVDASGNLQISDPSLAFSMGARPIVVVAQAYDPVFSTPLICGQRSLVVLICGNDWISGANGAVLRSL